MKRTVYHILKNNSIDSILNQSRNFFPFLDSEIISTFAREEVRFKRIGTVINAKNIDQIIPEDARQTWENIHTFVFFGRSNVGKSTLLNSLLSREVAPTSKRPGKTKELLLCDLETRDKAYFVDAPGYGYATGVSKGEIKKWGKMIQIYLRRTRSLKQHILCLIDLEHGLKQTDALVFEMLQAMNLRFQIIFTKCDSLKDDEVKKGLEISVLLQNTYSNMNFYTHFISSKENIGIDSLRNHLYFSIVGPKVN